MEKEVAELRAIIVGMTTRLQELEAMILTFRQAQLIMLGGSDTFLKRERTVAPKRHGEHRR